MSANEIPDDVVPGVAADEQPAPAGGEQYTGGVGSRREGRERAVALLYEAEIKSMPVVQLADELPVALDEFPRSLLEGVAAHLDEIDGLLREYARDWTLERMAAIDRAALRVGVFELVHSADVPTGVVISEAVELVKRYSTDESGRFVNGILAAIAHAARGEEPQTQLK